MKKKLFFAAVALVMSAATAVGYKAYDRGNISEFMMANIEALTQEESMTTWNCIGNTGDCYASCGLCGTVVSGKGDLKESHSCKKL